MNRENTNGGDDAERTRVNNLIDKRTRPWPPTWYTVILSILSTVAIANWGWLLAVATAGHDNTIDRAGATHLAFAALIGAAASAMFAGWMAMYTVNRRHKELDLLLKFDRERAGEQAAEQVEGLQTWMTENLWDIITEILRGDLRGGPEGKVMRIDRPPFSRRSGVNH